MLSIFLNKNLLAIAGILALVLVYACGDVTGRLAAKKGYRETPYFLMGIFLGLIGLIYAAGLPETEELQRKRLLLLMEQPQGERKHTRARESETPAGDLTERYMRLRI